MKKNNKPLRVGIVGAGLIGGKRAAAIASTKIGKLIAVCDPDSARAEKLAGQYRCGIAPSPEELVARKDIDIVIVAVPNKFTAPVSILALKNKNHVLAEKPFGRTAKEAQDILDAANKMGVFVKSGFNHRFHPGIWKAKQELDKGIIGEVMFIRARYGHGGRTGMEKEWRSNPEISGGGELLDQGVHVIDLCRWFGGEFEHAVGLAQTKFWNMDVDDNAFAILANKKTTAQFHVSTTNWGNIFSFEVFGKEGALAIEGLGRRYGEETLRVGIRKEPFNDLGAETFTYPQDADGSWDAEWRNFTSAILHGKASEIIGSGEDGLEANKIVEAIYRSSRSGKAEKPR